MTEKDEREEDALKAVRVLAPLFIVLCASIVWTLVT